jgi:membrane protein DedA with SNARE-associated domain/rhodanese-related sulfurtransferase
MNETTQFFISHCLPFIFVVVFIEQAGLPIPALPWLLAAGALSADGKVNGFLALGVVVLACITADMLWFHLGRRRGTQVLGWLCRISIEPDSCVRRTQNVFSRYGLRGLLVAKFVPGLNTIAPPLAGMSGIKLSRFLAFDAMGSLFYAAWGLGLGFFFSHQINQIVAAFSQIGGSALALLLGLLAFYIGYKYWRRLRLLHELRSARISVAELYQMLEAGEKPYIVDLRSVEELKLNPTVIRGAIHMEMDQLTNHSKGMPRDRDIIVYCSCPNEVSSARFALSLQKKGFTRVRPLLGGYDAWRKLEYPLDTWPSIASVSATANPPAEVAGNQPQKPT